jgi:hypothetical protein
MAVGSLNPTPQHKVLKKGEFLGRLDLALERDKVAVEYDGRRHLAPEQVIPRPREARSARSRRMGVHHRRR